MNNQASSPTPSANSFVRTVIYAALLACFSAYLALPSAIFACVCIILFLICSYKISQNKAIFVGIFAVCGVLLFVLPIASLAAAISTVAVASAGATMLYSGKRGTVAYILSTLAALITAFSFTGSLTAALGVLSPLPAAIVLAVCSKKKASRISTICAVSAALIVSAAIPFLWAVISEYGTDAGNIINELRTSFSSKMVEVFRAVADMTGTKLEDAIDIDSLAYTAELVFTLLPAIIISVSNILAFFISFLHAVIRYSFGIAQEKNEAVFRLSSVSAWLYILSIVSFFIAFGDSRLALVTTFAMGSLNIILTPAFALVGAAFMLSPNRRRRKNKKLRILLIIAGVLYLGALLVIPVALNGAILTLKLNKTNTPHEQR